MTRPSSFLRSLPECKLGKLLSGNVSFYRRKVGGPSVDLFVLSQQSSLSNTSLLYFVRRLEYKTKKRNAPLSEEMEKGMV